MCLRSGQLSFVSKQEGYVRVQRCGCSGVLYQVGEGVPGAGCEELLKWRALWPNSGRKMSCHVWAKCGLRKTPEKRHGHGTRTSYRACGQCLCDGSNNVSNCKGRRRKGGAHLSSQTLKPLLLVAWQS